MRQYLHSSIVDVPPESRHQFAIPEPECSLVPFMGKRPMPATKADAAALRGILHYLENPPRYDRPEVRRAHIDVLKRVVQVMEHGNPDSPFWYVCAAIKDSIRRVTPRRVVIHDMPLLLWAIDEIDKLMPPDEH